jgi:mannosyltransferase OCH1-like enzyme
MIPNRFLSIWLSKETNEPPPTPYVESWRRLMPDYEHVQITIEDAYRDSRFIREALDAENWRAASDYIRARYLYEHGGMYHDLDAEAITRFDDLLDNTCFCGCEDVLRVNNAVMGAEAGHWFLKEYLFHLDDMYRGDGDPRFSIFAGPGLLTLMLGRYGWRHRDEDIMISDIQIYNSKYFYPFHYTESFSPDCITGQTHAIHYWASLSER